MCNVHCKNWNYIQCMNSLEHTRQEPKRPKAHQSLCKKTLEYLRYAYIHAEFREV